MLIEILTAQPPLHNPMLAQIIRNTPSWVWMLLAALVALGISQLRSRQVGRPRLIVTPLIMLGLSSYGLATTFGDTGQLTWGLLAWLSSAAAITLLVLKLPLKMAGARYNRATRRFEVPGSIVPLLLMLGIFMTKYVVGIELALQPSLLRSTTFALTVSLIYGAFSGLFTASALRLLRLAWLQSPKPAESPYPLSSNHLTLGINP